LSDLDARIARIEDMTRRAWPPEEVEDLAGWELRATGGYTRRANSANPYPPNPADLTVAVEQVEGWYADRGRRSIFRLTPVSNPPGLEDLLIDRGYSEDGGTIVMVGPAAPGPSIEVAARSTDEWTAARDRWAPLGVEHRAAWLGLLDATVPPIGYGLVRSGDNIVVAAGHAVVEHDMVALFGLVVDPGRRGQGFGEHLSRGLISWGADQGAATVWLQVHSPTNPVALSLYRKLGLTTLYEYRYFTAPA
jgi:ribosomal protein S18 acetylase RimI-like enzyme